eukprot:jgi/Mesvir1/1270/Mv09558-RA.1
MTQRDVNAHHCVLMYLKNLLNTHHVKGFGGVPLPSPVVHRMTQEFFHTTTPATVLNSSLPYGMSEFQITQVTDSPTPSRATFPDVLSGPFLLEPSARVYGRLNGEEAVS